MTIGMVGLCLASISHIRTMARTIVYPDDVNLPDHEPDSNDVAVRIEFDRRNNRVRKWPDMPTSIGYSNLNGTRS